MKANTLEENKMGVMPVPKLLVNMALPMILSMLVQALYNIVDSIYVSQVSESAVTALSLAFPVQNMQVGFAVGIGVGVNSLLSKSLGQKNQEAADRAAGNGIFLMLIAVVIFVLFGLLGTRPYYAMQSQVAETVEGGIAYTRICCVFTLGMFVEILGSGCSRLPGGQCTPCLCRPRELLLISSWTPFSFTAGLVFPPWVWPGQRWQR